MLISLAAVCQIGGFDERFFCYYEEIEWCYRVQGAGLGVRIALGSVIEHAGGHSDYNANQVYYMARNDILLRSMYPHRTAATALAQLRHLRHANYRVRQGRFEEGESTAQGVVDAIFGRYGKRATKIGNLARFLARAWPSPLPL